MNTIQSRPSDRRATNEICWLSTQTSARHTDAILGHESRSLAIIEMLPILELRVR